MKASIRMFGMLLVLAASASASTSRASPSQPAAETVEQGEMLRRHFGDYPLPGDLVSILACAGASEVVWSASPQPLSPEDSEFKRKAGWYSPVALQIFGAPSHMVTDAVRDARRRGTQESRALASRCRPAPDHWSESK